MNASELKKAIVEKQQRREFVCDQSAKKFFSTLVAEMLLKEILNHKVPYSTVSSIVACDRCEIKVEDYISSYLIPEFRKNGFECHYIKEGKVLEIKVQ